MQGFSQLSLDIFISFFNLLSLRQKKLYSVKFIKRLMKYFASSRLYKMCKRNLMTISNNIATFIRQEITGNEGLFGGSVSLLKFIS